MTSAAEKPPIKEDANVPDKNEQALRERKRAQAIADRKRDEQLVKKALKGDKEVFRELFEHYRNRAYSVAFGIVRNAEDAEDVVQESFVKAYLALKSYRGQASFYTWLFRIVTNMAIDYRRKLARRGGPNLEYNEVFLNTSGSQASEITSASETGTVNGGDTGRTPFQLVSTKQELQRLSKGISDLSEEHRAVITLREIEGMSYDEIAKMTGTSKGTVMSRLHYARKYLQNALSGDS